MDKRTFLHMVVLGAAGVMPRAAGAQTSEGVLLEQALAEVQAGRALLFDIREPSEHASGVAREARLLPMRQLASRIAEIPADPQRPVYLICQTQSRSRAAVAALRERGYSHVRFVQGGMSEWTRRGLPLVKPSP